MAKLKFGSVEENVVTREEFPLKKAQEVLKDEVVAVLGYGVQGPGQACCVLVLVTGLYGHFSRTCPVAIKQANSH